MSHFSTIAEKNGGVADHGQEDSNKQEVEPRRPSRKSISSFTSGHGSGGSGGECVGRVWGQSESALERDKAVALSCWLLMGGNEDTLRNGAGEDASGWKGVEVVEGRVTELLWGAEGLSSCIPPDIGHLNKLTTLLLNNNALKGCIPCEIGSLTSLTSLALSTNDLEGEIPFSFARLNRLTNLSLVGNNKIESNEQIPNHLQTHAETQAYLATLWRPQALRLITYGIAIARRRQARMSSDGGAGTPPDPFFAFLATHEDSVTDLILSYLDPDYCCIKDRNALLKCWRSLGGIEDDLREGYGDDVSRWKGVKEVEDGRVTKVDWGELSLTGTIPAEIGELDGLRELWLYGNEISSIPSEIGKLASLDCIWLYNCRLEGPLPAEIGNLISLRTLDLSTNKLSGPVPPTLAKLTNLSQLYLRDNDFSTVCPPHRVANDKEIVQGFLASLKLEGENKNS
eukprot:CAMPEP_0197548264 /NCGR_PEP_ID=MMETSP1320-20131121/2427_1 /TAXON_ID=91990 /ORGANISM="Bolidomonas sp., Strain RCC2347" /LENGTH=454 /DNA_ID=CAMNT_0043108247 /DNA_START=282 /DNA_END=1646 /DNA_ORIENTATION=-